MDELGCFADVSEFSTASCVKGERISEDNLDD